MRSQELFLPFAGILASPIRVVKEIHGRPAAIERHKSGSTFIEGEL
jgi:hypothetical protein